MRFNKVYELIEKHSKAPLRPVDVAKALNVSRSNINYKRDKNVNLNDEEIEKLEKFFNMNLTESACQTAKLIEELEQKRQVNDNLAQIEYFPDVYLSAGYGVEVLDEYSETVVIDERFLMSERGMRVNPKNCKMVRISGNSMFPEYHHGDRVIIDESDQNLTDGQIYAFRYDGQCYVKEINRAGNKIKCISVNKEYEPFFIERDVDFKVFGRILPRIRL